MSWSLILRMRPPNSVSNEPIHPHPRFDFTEFFPNLCLHFDKLFRPPAVPVVSLRDPRFAFCGLWTRTQAAVQSATSFAFNWWFLARGAFAGLGITTLAGPIRAKSQRDALFKFGVYHSKIFTPFKFLFYPIWGSVARCLCHGP